MSSSSLIVICVTPVCVTYILNCLYCLDSPSFSLLYCPDKDRQLLLTKISELEKQVRRTEDENADLKENLDFISSERDVLSDAIRELEDSLNQEKKGRQNEKESLEELATHSTVLYDKVCSKK